MLTPDEGYKAQRALSGWSATKTTAGVLLIVTTVIGVIEVVLALRDGTDTSQALKWPVALVLVLVYLFLRSDRRVRQLRAALNQ